MLKLSKMNRLISSMKKCQPSRFKGNSPIWRYQERKCPKYIPVAEMSDGHLKNALKHERKKGKVGTLELEKVINYLNCFDGSSALFSRAQAEEEVSRVSVLKTEVNQLETDPWIDVLLEEAVNRGICVESVIDVKELELTHAKSAEEYHDA